MAKSPQLDKVIEAFKAYGESTCGLESVEEFRASYEKFGSQFPLAADIVCRPWDAAGVPGEWIVAPGAADDRALLFLHGGGYSIGSINTHREVVSRISRAAGVMGLAIDYRLAPEHPFPAAVDDAVAVYRWLLSNGFQPSRIAISGDSAGGGLTLAALLALKDAGDPLPAAGIPLSAWTDLEGVGESMTTLADVDPRVTKDVLEYMAKNYIGDRDPRMPLAAPLYGDMRGLPPLLLQVGGAEVLRDDSTRVVELAKAAGVDATVEVWDDMIHDWHQFAYMLPEGQQAIDRIGEFIRQHMK